MAQRFYNDPANFGIGYPVIGANSITFGIGDPVYINTSGFLDLVSTSSKVLGYSVDDVGLMTSSNQTVAFVTPKYCYADAVLMVFPFAAAAAATQTQVGEYAIVSANTSGAFTLNASTSATVGQFLIVGINPNNQGSTSAGSAAELSEVVVRAAFLQAELYASS